MNETTLMRDFAMVFPGQGSQSVGMLAELAEAFPLVSETFSAGFRRTRLRSLGARATWPCGASEPDRLHPAGDVGGGCGYLALLAG